MGNVRVKQYIFLVCLCATVAAQRQCVSTFCSHFLSQSESVDNNVISKSWPVPIEDYIKQHGYPVEAHEITTQDGYVLTYHRIPHGRSPSDDNSKRKPVLLQHGLLSSSAVWVLSEDSLGYSLVDAGFDLWLGNARGNTYSRRHVKYDPDMDKQTFWDFSWHEMGYYDLPASIDYILNVTDSKQLFYIGHSMGTTMYFVLGSTRPEYMDKIEAAVALAPVVFPWNMQSPTANFLNRFYKVLDWLAKEYNIYELFPFSEHTFWLDEHVCSLQKYQFLCRDVIFSLTGFDNSEINTTALGLFLNYLPAGSSFKQLQHYHQICIKGVEFTQFNYGFMGNLWRYGSFWPPSYNLTNVNAPLYIYYATNDWLAVPEDIYYTVKHLTNVQGLRKVPYKPFNHIDFMWARDAKTLVYDDVISTLHNLTKWKNKSSSWNTLFKITLPMHL